MSGKLPEFESVDFDSADIIKEDARVDSFEAKLDEDRQQQHIAALQQQSVHEAVSQCLGACLAYLDTLYLQRDAKPCSEVALAHNSWQQEAEPEPCSRDAWLRGALPETVVAARTPNPPAGAQAAARSSAGKEQRARPGSGLLSHSRKGPASVASSAAADDAQHRPQSKAQQSRRNSIAQSMHSMKVTDSTRPASGSRPGTNSSTAMRPASGTAGNHSTPPAAAAAAANAGDSSSPAVTQPAGDDGSITAEPAASRSPAVPEAANSATTAAGTAAAHVSTQRKQTTKASELTPDQQEAEDRLRQELQLRRQQEAVVKEMKQKDEAARAALLNMQKDLKGKDYTYDGKGKVVPLAKVNPEALPAPPGPQFKVQLNTSGAAADSAAGTAAAAAAAAAAAGGAAAGKQAAASRSSAVAASSSSKQSSGAAAPAAARTSGTKDAAGGKDAANPFYVEQASRTQPPVLQSIKPSAGVTLKVGGSAKQGPKRETSAQQQTRTQFQQQAKTLNMQTAKAAAGAGLGALGSGSRHSNSRVSSAAGMRSSSGGGSSSGGVGSIPGSARSGRGDSAGSRASSAARSTTGAVAAAAGTAAGDAAAAAEGQTTQASRVSAGPAVAGSVKQGASSASAAEGDGVNKAGRGSAGDCSSGPDINLLLVNAPDWGVASGGGPCAVGQVVDVAKPSDRQLQEEFGRTTHLPKTRAPVATLKTPKTQPNSTSRLSQLA